MVKQDGAARDDCAHTTQRGQCTPSLCVVFFLPGTGTQACRLNTKRTKTPLCFFFTITTIFNHFKYDHCQHLNVWDLPQHPDTTTTKFNSTTFFFAKFTLLVFIVGITTTAATGIFTHRTDFSPCFFFFFLFLFKRIFFSFKPYCVANDY